MNRPLARAAVSAFTVASMLLPAWVAAQTANPEGVSGTITGTPGGVTQPMTAGPGASARTDARAGSLSLHHTDRRFVARALADGLAEVELGRLAQQQGASDTVRQFGQRMVDEHGKTNEQLQRFAQTKGVVPPDTPDPADRARRAGLEKLSGSAFDRAYLRNQVKAHREAVQRYEGQVRGGRDAELRQFAADTLPALREHLRMARDATR